VSYGTIYPTLNRLESDGLVTRRIEVHDGKPDSKIYAITQLGRDYLVGTMNSLPNYDKFQSEFLLMSLNAKLASRQFLDTAVETQLKQVEEEISAIDSLLADCDDPAVIWVAEYGRTMMQTKAKYYRTNKDQLLKLTETHSLKFAAGNRNNRSRRLMKSAKNL